MKDVTGRAAQWFEFNECILSAMPLASKCQESTYHFKVKLLDCRCDPACMAEFIAVKKFVPVCKAPSLCMPVWQLFEKTGVA